MTTLLAPGGSSAYPVQVEDPTGAECLLDSYGLPHDYDPASALAGSISAAMVIEGTILYAMDASWLAKARMDALHDMVRKA